MAGVIPADSSKPDPASPQRTYWGSDRDNRIFDILIDGEKLITQSFDAPLPGKFIDIVTPVPAAMAEGKKKVEVRVQAHPGATAGGIFEMRIMRGSAIAPELLRR